MRVHVARSYDEAGQFDAAFWKRAGVNARFAAAWSMISDYLKMRGKYAGEPRLRRARNRMIFVASVRMSERDKEDEQKARRRS